MADILQRYADRGMEMYLRTHGVRQFDFPSFAQPLRDEIRNNVLRGENTIAGFRNADVRRHMPDKSTCQVSRRLKRPWTHNLIRKLGGTYKYYITEPGRAAITTGLKLKELVLVPELARALA